MALIDESGLIQRAAAGDPEAFNALAEQYQGLAYGVANRALGDPEAAADATQEAFLSAWGAIAGFRSGSFRGWLMRIVTHACFDAGRRIQRRPPTSLDAIVETPGGEDVAVDTAPLPEVEALRVELAEHIQERLLKLPFDQRAAVVMSDIHGLSYEEIAEATGAALGTVKSRINRGRLRLRELLMQRPELLPSGRRPREW